MQTHIVTAKTTLGWALAVVAISHVFAEEKIWTSSGFLDFVDGTLTDGGVNTYVAADGTIRLVNLQDLNNDGNFDLPVPCGQDHDERVDMFVYWADENGLHADRKLRLPTEGAIDAAARDLNRDGYVDLVVANRFDGENTELDSYVYWGSRNGFDAANRLALRTRAASAVAVADLNGDKYPEIVFANRGVDYHMVVDNFQKSFIYWGSKNGYSEDQRSSVSTVNCSDVKVADVNQDNHPDLLFVNEGNRESESGVVIYFGNSAGQYKESRRLELPGVYSSAIAVADLNADGYIEIVLANMYRLHAKPDPPTGNHVKTYRVNSCIYWGDAAGYSTERRTELPTVGARSVATGDLNSDGKPDIVFPASTEDVSVIYWNGPEGFSPRRQSQVMAYHAHDAAIDDLDQDGHMDLVLANYAHAGFFDTVSYVYRGGPDGISDERRTELPTSGATGIVVADLNGDTQKDVAFVNKIEGVSYPGGTTTSVTEVGPTTSWVYWGDVEGRFSPDRRQGLPTMRNTDGYVASDLNADGHVDLLFAHDSTPTIIYWGSDAGFSSKNRSTVPEGNSGTGRTADLNRDGYLDVLLNSAVIYGQKSGFSTTNRFNFEPTGYILSLADLNRDGWLDVVAPTHGRVTVFWNTPGGFDNTRVTVLSIPGKHADMVEMADFNGDTWLDLVVVNQVDALKPVGPGEAAVHHANPYTVSYIYWGSPDGYSASCRLELPTVGSNDAVAADFNSDGYVDIFFSSYLAGFHRHFPGYIYWNGSDGFNAQRRTPIPGFSGCGVLAADCNLDGYQELIVANHTRIGNHRSDLWVHWGSSEGFSANDRTSLPAAGPHFLGLVDTGNIFDRSDRYDYISPPHDTGPDWKFKSLSWKAATPFATALEFQIRTAAKKAQLESTPWRGPDGLNSVFGTSGNRIGPTDVTHRWIQYKATLISPNSANTPVLDSVSVICQRN